MLHLLCQGLSNKRIASGLGIAIKTIDTHRQHIMDRTGCKGPVELGVYAMRHGLFGFSSSNARADAVAVEATEAGL